MQDLWDHFITWKLSKKPSDTVLFGRENDDVHVPVHLAHMSKIAYLDDPALHVSLELHGILSWIWCCQVSAGVVQTERTVSDLGSPSAPPRPMTSPVVSPVVSAASSGGKCVWSEAHSAWQTGDEFPNPVCYQCLCILQNGHIPGQIWTLLLEFQE